MNLNDNALKVLHMLEEQGFEAYAVGGCVRDALLGEEPKDVDITTSAHPDEVKEIFNRTFDTGIEHGTVTVRMGGESFEVTTYRTDGKYLDHRRPSEVSYTLSLEEDLKRRDFTINAMAWHPKKGVIDLFGGREDLENHLVRAVGKATERFDEDALRMLRAIRFASRLDFEIEAETYAAIRTKAPLLEFVSRERVMDELSKTLLSNHPERLALMKESGLVRYVHPALVNLTEDDYARLSQITPERELRFALMLRPLGAETAGRVLSELKSDNHLKYAVTHYISALDLKAPEDEEEMRRALGQVGKAEMPGVIELRQVLGMDTAEETARLYALYESQKEQPVTIKELAVTGTDLMRVGVPAGKEVGRVLEALLEQVLSHPEMNTAETLLSVAAEGQL